ncbi:MAG: DUF4381 domain-containing protein [Gammaproteobacteria bacterium]
MADAEINPTGSLRLEYSADIEFGPAVTQSGVWLSLVAMMVVVILGIAIWRRYNSPCNWSLRALKQLRVQFARDEIDSRQVVYGLAVVMRRAAGVSRLSSDMPLGGIAPERWQQFHRTLAAARYSREGISAVETTRLIDEGRFWVRSWR